MNDGEVRYVRDGEVATVMFDRPAARNAMTWRMYEQFGEACARIRAEARACGSRCFAAPAASPSSPAPTSRNSRPFAAVRTASPTKPAWKAISRRSRRCRYRRWRWSRAMPSAAGWRSRRPATFALPRPASRFGVPIARTLGNCLSIANCARLVAALGASRAKRILLLAENSPPRRRLPPASSARSSKPRISTGASPS